MTKTFLTLLTALSFNVSAQTYTIFVGANSQKGIKDNTGKEIAPPKYFDIQFISDGMSAVRIGNDLHGYIDSTGKEIVPVIYSDALPFQNGYGIVSLRDKKGNSKQGFVDKKGNLVVPVIYDRLVGFHDGLSLFEVGSKRGFVDVKGNEVFSSTKYDFIGLLSYNRAVVSKKERYGYIDHTGKEIIPLKYNIAEEFDSGGRGKVRIKEQYFFIDTLGNIINNNAGFNITSRVNVAKDRWVVVTSKKLDAKEPIFYLTAAKYGKYAAPFAAAITWQIINSKNVVIKEGRSSVGDSFAFKVPEDDLYTVQAYYDMKDCIGCRIEDRPNAFTMEYSFNTKL